MIPRLLLLSVLCIAAWLLPACHSRQREPTPPGAGGSESVSVPDPAAPTALPTTTKKVARIDGEPLIRVFLAEKPAVSFTLLVPATLPDGRTLPGGPHRAQPDGDGLVIDGFRTIAECPLIAPPAAKRFTTEPETPAGHASSLLSFSGLPILRRVGGNIQLLEEVPLETYLKGVVPCEMTPGWPLEALKAQAIAARSYAAAKYLERFDRPWQLHWHFTVDMAYGGVSSKRTARSDQAVNDTIGRILSVDGRPVPALFHACSGGTTEAAANLWPSMVAASAMPVVSDPSAEAGCHGLGMTRTHWRWKADIPLADISRGLQTWTRTHPEDKLAFGTVSGIETGPRFKDSGRVAQVTVIHRLNGKLLRTAMAAQDFRMAIDPGRCRSTWWDRCVVAANKTLVLQGRGFGHGVGLSQVSAWQLARDGQGCERILARFYPTATLSARW